MAVGLVPLGSPLVGKRLQDAGFTEARGLRVIDLIRRDRSLGVELAEAVLQPRARVVVRSNVGDMLALREAGHVPFGGRAAHATAPIAAPQPVASADLLATHSPSLTPLLPPPTPRPPPTPSTPPPPP